MLSRLVQVEQTGGAFRQSALLEAWHADPAARRLIDALSRDERPLLRVDDATVPTVGLAHDGLLQAWRRLDNNAWWSGLKRRPREGWNAERRGNYPATRLSWHDATAFCRWLGARLGLDVRLPEEWEWQWAAQSALEDFVYPWGCDWLPARGNTDEAGIGRTMAVGINPAGQSLQGVSDLAGNTWEWCRSGV